MEFDDLGKDRTDQREEAKWAEQAEREDEETSFIENTAKTDADNIRTWISSKTPTQSETRVDLNDFSPTDLEKQIQDHTEKKAFQRFNAIQALESMTDTKFSVTHGDSSKELIDYVSDAKYSEKGNLIALKCKGEDVKLTAKGKLDGRSANTDNKDILKAIENAKVEYKGSLDAVVDEGAGISMSDEARKSVKENVVAELVNKLDDIHNGISKIDLDGNVIRELRGIRYADNNIDYDNLEDPNQKKQYNAKIDGIKTETKHWEELKEKEQNPLKKELFRLVNDFCVVKESEMEAKTNLRPESEETQTMIKKEAKRNDLTRFERSKKWAKKNITGVSAVAISIAGIITAAVMTGRNAAKKIAKPVGQFGKALANIAKKAAPAIATILNILAQALTWGAKALEFLSRNLWIVALFLTYLLYDTLKDRYNKN